MLNFAANTAREAGRILLEKFGRVLKTSYKGDKNIVTEADLASEEYILGQIRTHFPRHAILAEEAGAVVIEGGESEWRWVIDPLDGTTNFSHGYPCFCVSIGLEKDGKPEIGVIYDPTRDEMFSAERGNGATLNGRKIQASSVETLDNALLVTGFPYDVRKRERFVEQFSKFVLNAQAVRRDGSAALDLAYVACGRFEGFWEEGLSPWDTAAGSLIVQEAGGRVSQFDGSNFDIYRPQILATNGLIHEKMLEILS
ncbi:MAG TPA: inositol monophosphatase family protein [Pyrinomonadaceae bacterium]|nr:inositol monophosphatase family protein [Pyrinomonadaceae bacterium]